MRHTIGDLLSIHLGDQRTATESVDNVLERFIGGRGVGTRLAYERIPFDAEPFGPENRLYFTTGPLQASNMSFTGRTNCTGLSPLTDGLLSSNAGGFLSRNLAETGYGAVEVTGKSDELIVIHVTDQGVEFEPVPELAGADVPTVVDELTKRPDLDVDNTAVIGPAGENEVRFASIMTSETRAFGRGGLGAVLGSKNVKAITFSGDSPPAIDVPDMQMEIHREAATSDHIMKRQGTTSVTELANEMDALPTRYFSQKSFESAEDIGGAAVESKKFEKGTCSACAFACKLPTKDEEAGIETEGPEYETVMSFGSNAGVDDIVDVMRSNEQCDRYGLDTISAGNVVSAYLAATGEFGNVDLIEELVEQIAHREGEGDLLAEGIDRCHEELGVENWTVKGLEFPAHDGRTLNGQGLGYATANRGADHMFAVFYSYEYPLVAREDAVEPSGLGGKPELLVEQENRRALEDCGIICRFSRDFLTDDRLERLLGRDLDSLLSIGSEVIALERHFNNQRGFDRTDDRLPYEIPGFENALDEYYAVRGWRADGTVPPEKISVAGGADQQQLVSDT